MNILILTGKFGMGHYSASDSIRQQLKKKFPTAQITVVDFFQYTMPKASKFLYQGFTLMVNRASLCYNLLYKLSDTDKLDSKPFLWEHFIRPLNKMLNDLKPDLVISTIPFCSQLISLYKEKTHVTLPLVTCITDISSHSEWINDYTDCYLVASSSIQQSLIQKGVMPNKIEIIGIPVRAEFKEAPDHEFSSSSSLEKKILIMGGGLGLLPKSERFYQSLNNLSHVKTTVITGKNKKLYQLLHRKYENIEVIGFTNEVYKYMHQADLIISKPGGITVFEAIHSELPILAIHPFLQQEINNANFINRHNVGKVMGKEKFKDIDYISHLIYDDVTLSEMKLNMKSLKRQINPNALERFILSLHNPELGEYAS